jgi:DNA gyrase subunit B
VHVRSDDLSEKHMLRIERMHHGNVKVSASTPTSCKARLRRAGNGAATFEGLIGEGAFVRRGEGERVKEIAVATSTRPCNGCATKPNAACRNSATKVWAK